VEEVTTSEVTVEHDLTTDVTDETSVLCVVPSATTYNTEPSVVLHVTTAVPNVTVSVSNVTAAVPLMTCSSVQSSCTEEALPSSPSSSLSSLSRTVTAAAAHGTTLVSSSNKHHCTRHLTKSPNDI